LLPVAKLDRELGIFVEAASRLAGIKAGPIRSAHLTFILLKIYHDMKWARTVMNTAAPRRENGNLEVKMRRLFETGGMSIVSFATSQEHRRMLSAALVFQSAEILAFLWRMPTTFAVTILLFPVIMKLCGPVW
jgi:hypothetical protein